MADVYIPKTAEEKVDFVYEFMKENESFFGKSESYNVKAIETEDGVGIVAEYKSPNGTGVNYLYINPKTDFENITMFENPIPDSCYNGDRLVSSTPYGTYGNRHNRILKGDFSSVPENAIMIPSSKYETGTSKTVYSPDEVAVAFINKVGNKPEMIATVGCSNGGGGSLKSGIFEALNHPGVKVEAWGLDGYYQEFYPEKILDSLSEEEMETLRENLTFVNVIPNEKCQGGIANGRPRYNWKNEHETSQTMTKYVLELEKRGIKNIIYTADFEGVHENWHGAHLDMYQFGSNLPDFMLHNTDEIKCSGEYGVIDGAYTYDGIRRILVPLGVKDDISQKVDFSNIPDYSKSYIKYENEIELLNNIRDNLEMFSNSNMETKGSDSFPGILFSMTNGVSSSNDSFISKTKEETNALASVIGSYIILDKELASDADNLKDNLGTSLFDYNRVSVEGPTYTPLTFSNINGEIDFNEFNNMFNGTSLCGPIASFIGENKQNITSLKSSLTALIDSEYYSSPGLGYIKSSIDRYSILCDCNLELLDSMESSFTKALKKVYDAMDGKSIDLSIEDELNDKILKCTQDIDNLIAANSEKRTVLVATPVTIPGKQIIVYVPKKEYVLSESARAENERIIESNRKDIEDFKIELQRIADVKEAIKEAEELMDDLNIEIQQYNSKVEHLTPTPTLSLYDVERLKRGENLGFNPTIYDVGDTSKPEIIETNEEESKVEPSVTPSPSPTPTPAPSPKVEEPSNVSEPIEKETEKTSTSSTSSTGFGNGFLAGYKPGEGMSESRIPTSTEKEDTPQVDIGDRASHAFSGPDFITSASGVLGSVGATAIGETLNNSKSPQTKASDTGFGNNFLAGSKPEITPKEETISSSQVVETEEKPQVDIGDRASHAFSGPDFESNDNKSIPDLIKDLFPTKDKEDTSKDSNDIGFGNNFLAGSKPEVKLKDEIQRPVVETQRPQVDIGDRGSHAFSGPNFERTDKKDQTTISTEKPVINEPNVEEIKPVVTPQNVIPSVDNNPHIEEKTPSQLTGSVPQWQPTPTPQQHDPVVKTPEVEPEVIIDTPTPEIEPEVIIEPPTPEVEPEIIPEPIIEPVVIVDEPTIDPTPEVIVDTPVVEPTPEKVPESIQTTPKTPTKPTPQVTIPSSPIIEEPITSDINYDNIEIINADNSVKPDLTNEIINNTLEDKKENNSNVLKDIGIIAGVGALAGASAYGIYKASENKKDEDEEKTE